MSGVGYRRGRKRVAAVASLGIALGDGPQDVLDSGD